MKLICLFGLALFSLAQASPSPAVIAQQAISKTYTLPDGTIVHEMIIHENGKTIIVRRYTHHQIENINHELESLPNTRIIKNPPGAPNILAIPANELYQFLIKHGYEWPADSAGVPFFGENPTRIVTVYLPQIYKLLANVNTLKEMPPVIAVQFMKTRPYLQIRKAPQKPRCKQGLIGTAANDISKAASGILGGVADLFGSGVLGEVAHGASALVSNVVGGADTAIQDAACGVENMADTAASALDTGNLIDIVEGAGDMLGEAVSGVTDAVAGAVNKVADGLSDTVKDLLSAIVDFL